MTLHSGWLEKKSHCMIQWLKKVHRPKLGLKNINDLNDNSGSTFNVPEYYTVPPVLGGHMAKKLTWKFGD
jgi:hypothetical protein